MNAKSVRSRFQRKLPHLLEVLLLSLLAALPALAVALLLLWRSPVSAPLAWAVTLLLLGTWAGCAWLIQTRVARPLQTISNLILALREEDFSIRASGVQPDDPLGNVLFELNALSDMLREQRLGAIEASALLRTVMEEIGMAVFTFDEAQQLRLVNRAGERLLGRPAERLLGLNAAELGLADCLQGEPIRTIQARFSGSLGRWGMRRSTFRQRGRPHQLLVLADLSQALREEERQAWQRLLRVLGHELNNSLAPIKSISHSLGQLLSREPLPADWQDDARQGLAVISSRAEALSRFMEEYSRVARLPQPRLQPVPWRPLLQRVVELETRLQVQLLPGPELLIQADPDQLEQLLINLVRNAVDAALETEGTVRLSWCRSNGQVELRAEDDGPGLANTTNLFVPFFTTKPGGSGIGLVLSRQIAEAHGGSLALENRQGHPGCVATLRLPLGTSSVAIPP